MVKTLFSTITLKISENTLISAITVWEVVVLKTPSNSSSILTVLPFILGFAIPMKVLLLSHEFDALESPSARMSLSITSLSSNMINESTALTCFSP